VLLLLLAAAAAAAHVVVRTPSRSYTVSQMATLLKDTGDWKLVSTRVILLNHNKSLPAAAREFCQQPVRWLVDCVRPDHRLLEARQPSSLHAETLCFLFHCIIYSQERSARRVPWTSS
jgi:hypothetical protein